MKNFFRHLVPWRRKEESSPQIHRNDSRAISWPLSDFPALVDDFLEGFGIEHFRKMEERIFGFAPPVDVHDRGNEIVVTAEVPGLDESDLELALDGEALVLSGEKKREQERQDARSYYRESSYGAFRRVIPLDGIEIDADNVKASLRKGQLSVRLPKTPRARDGIKRVSIEVARPL